MVYDEARGLESEYEIFQGQCVTSKGSALKGYVGCMSLSQCTEACAMSSLECVALTINENGRDCDDVQCSLHTNAGNDLNIPTNKGFTSALDGSQLDSRVFHRYQAGLWCLKRHGVDYSSESRTCGNFLKDHNDFFLLVAILTVTYYCFILLIAFTCGFSGSQKGPEGIFHNLFGDTMCSRRTLCPNLRGRTMKKSVVRKDPKTIRGEEGQVRGRPVIRPDPKYKQLFQWFRTLGFTGICATVFFFLNIATDVMFAFSIFDSEKCIAQISIASSLLAGSLFVFILYCDFQHWKIEESTREIRGLFRLRWGILVLTPVEDIIQSSIVALLILDGNETLWAWISIFITILNVLVFRILRLCVSDLFTDAATPYADTPKVHQVDEELGGNTPARGEDLSTREGVSETFEADLAEAQVGIEIAKLTQFDHAEGAQPGVKSSDPQPLVKADPSISTTRRPQKQLKSSLSNLWDELAARGTPVQE